MQFVERHPIPAIPPTDASPPHQTPSLQLNAICAAAPDSDDFPSALSPTFLRHCHRPALLETAMAPTRSLPVLPEDMLIEVAARVAASSSSPMADLHCLCGACALVRDRVCGASLVHRSLNLSRVLMRSEDAGTREQLIANTYAAGNLVAHFIQGMRVFFGQHGRALHAPLDNLDQAASGGHKPTALMLTMILWRANNGVEVNFCAKQLLAEVADDDPAIAAFQVLWMFVWPPNNQQPGPMPGPLPRIHVHQCASPRWGWVQG